MTVVTADNLNSVMEFDRVIRVAADGTVSDSPESPYVELSYYKGDDEKWHEEFNVAAGWELLKGFTGQYGYNGPCMHVSEYIGGGLARHILETPGDYVAVTVESFCGYTEDHCTEDAGCDCAPEGWAVAFKPATTEGN